MTYTMDSEQTKNRFWTWQRNTGPDSSYYSFAVHSGLRVHYVRFVAYLWAEMDTYSYITKKLVSMLCRHDKPTS